MIGESANHPAEDVVWLKHLISDFRSLLKKKQGSKAKTPVTLCPFCCWDAALEDLHKLLHKRLYCLRGGTLFVIYGQIWKRWHMFPVHSHPKETKSSRGAPPFHVFLIENDEHLTKYKRSSSVYHLFAYHKHSKNTFLLFISSSVLLMLSYSPIHWLLSTLIQWLVVCGQECEAQLSLRLPLKSATGVVWVGAHGLYVFVWSWAVVMAPFKGIGWGSCPHLPHTPQRWTIARVKKVLI